MAYPRKTFTSLDKEEPLKGGSHFDPGEWSMSDPRRTFTSSQAMRSGRIPKGGSNVDPGPTLSARIRLTHTIY